MIANRGCSGEHIVEEDTVANICVVINYVKVGGFEKDVCDLVISGLGFTGLGLRVY